MCCVNVFVGSWIQVKTEIWHCLKFGSRWNHAFLRNSTCPSYLFTWYLFSHEGLGSTWIQIRDFKRGPGLYFEVTNELIFVFKKETNQNHLITWVWNFTPVSGSGLNPVVHWELLLSLPFASLSKACSTIHLNANRSNYSKPREKVQSAQREETRTLTGAEESGTIWQKRKFLKQWLVFNCEQ